MRVLTVRLLYAHMVLLLGTASTITASAGGRIALVVGCGNYKAADEALPTSLNDADDIADKLQYTLGFEVIRKPDANLDAFHEGLAQLKEKATGAEVLLFYFSGHGIELDGANYCIPIDAVLNQPFQLRSQTIPLEVILRDYLDPTGAKAKIVILDACRTSPFPQTRRWYSHEAGKGVTASPGVLASLGQAEMPSGLLISYAAAPLRPAAPGRTDRSRNSLYTEFLLKHLADRGRSLRDVFESVKDEVSDATGQRQDPYLDFEGGSSAFRKLALIPDAAITAQTPSPSVSPANPTASASPIEFATSASPMQTPSAVAAMRIPFATSASPIRHPSIGQLERTRRGFVESGISGVIFDYAPRGLTESEFRDKLISEGVYSTSITSLPPTRKDANLIKQELDRRGIVVTIEELADVTPPYVAECPTVLYYADESEKIATELAFSFTQLTGVKFEASRGATPPKGPALRFAIHCIPLAKKSQPSKPKIQGSGG